MLRSQVGRVKKKVSNFYPEKKEKKKMNKKTNKHKVKKKQKKKKNLQSQSMCDFQPTPSELKM